MCLIIHKPAGVAIREDLLRAAVSLNQDGWGLMGFTADGRLLLEKHPVLSVEELLEAEWRYRDAEYLLHIRKRTRGSATATNTHPFKLRTGLYLMHNGTLNLPLSEAGMSDTWHFAHHVLKPLDQRHPGLLLDNAFHRLLEVGLRPENKLALLDQNSRRIVLINHQHGAMLDGLWLSSTRWIDRRLLPLVSAPQPQERSYVAQEIQFL